MLPRTIQSVACALAALVTSTLGLESGRPAKLPLPARIVYQFPSETWIENIAVRPNGDLLLTTLLPKASLYTVQNPQHPHARAKLLHTFDVDSLTGIAEVKPDKFVVLGGNFSANAVGVPGTFSAWVVEFESARTPSPRIKKSATIRDAVFFNGVTALPGRDEVLIADSTLGLAWHLDVDTGKYRIGLREPHMLPAPKAPLKIGINGIHFFRGFIYWTNSFEATLYRIKVGHDGRAVAGAAVEVVGKADAMFLDDFAMDSRATAWAATHLDNKLVVIRPNGASTVVLGSPTELVVAGGTSCAFGRTAKDYQTLYVVTDGGIANSGNGAIVEGGKVVAVDTSRF